MLKRFNFEGDENKDSLTFQFTIGLLEILGISAFLTDDSGKIVGYNSQMTELVGDRDLTGSY
jgi:hypothetical protein